MEPMTDDEQINHQFVAEPKINNIGQIYSWTSVYASYIYSTICMGCLFVRFLIEKFPQIVILKTL